MRKTQYDNRRRSSVILDAGYVSIKTNNQSKSSQILGLHGQKLFCIILTIFLLFFISSINLTCLIWIMSKLDWSPFHKNGSKIFYFDQINQHIQLYNQGRFNETIYTTKINDLLQINLTSDKQIDIYGDHNSILLDGHQIAMNTEYFYMNNKSLIDFNNLQSFKFDQKKSTRIHLDRINSYHIHSNYLNISTDKNLMISNVNKVVFSSQNLNIEANKNNRQSIIHFANYLKRKKSFDPRQKVSYGNIDFQTDSTYLDLPKVPLAENTDRGEASIYRICICNTTFLLLRSFAHQPCPLC